MALEPATIAVNWTSNYAGQHRVCYREGGAGPYTCILVSCPGGGAPCSYDIAITVDNETCVQRDFDGYVQPACEDEVSLVGRIPFAVSFIPDPACNKYDVTCDDAGVDTITLTNPGSGYLGVPNVSLAGGGGQGATATATLGTGIVAGAVLALGGGGYAEPDGVQVGIPLIGLTQVPTTGVGATVDVTFTAGVITGIVLNAPGSGYFSNETQLTIDNTALAVGTPPATEGTINISASDSWADEVDVFNVTAPGSGYTSAPAVIVDPPAAGVTAAGTAALLSCSPLLIYDCSGASIYSHPTGSLFPGESISICGNSVPSIPSDYSVVEDPAGNCLCTCEDVDLSSAGADTTVRYIDCDTGLAVEQVLLAGALAINVCIVIDSLTYVEDVGATFSLVVNGPCDGV